MNLKFFFVVVIFRVLLLYIKRAKASGIIRECFIIDFKLETSNFWWHQNYMINKEKNIKNTENWNFTIYFLKNWNMYLGKLFKNIASLSETFNYSLKLFSWLQREQMNCFEMFLIVLFYFLLVLKKIIFGHWRRSKFKSWIRHYDANNK